MPNDLQKLNTQCPYCEKELTDRSCAAKYIEHSYHLYGDKFRDFRYKSFVFTFFVKEDKWGMRDIEKMAPINTGECIKLFNDFDGVKLYIKIIELLK
jgi:hypothetical protein